MNPTCRFVSVTVAVPKFTPTRPAEISVPTAPVDESVGFVPPTGANSTMPEVGRSVATTP